ncbi:hypothetical protein [Dichotomicrobium thermohalophilum]|uniref:Uncharacterized protein n=1 Tax=Dichotomicrobium thermohalophilum TaxID=933063 RepID=A0A397PCJ5_9HYPH|nr:hypothetical protein [Dichotomicrobium thermohalophilum]RIA47290.1 hypothetical protein BXY53_2673 [Dichotomicrobium thermohalophilum]
METQPSDQKRHIRQALADLVFGLALFAIFVLLGVFGVKQASSEVGIHPPPAQEAPLPKDNPGSVVRDILLPLGGRT